MNDLTKRLLAEGWTRENHPDSVFWGAYDEGFEYKWEYQITLTWRTGCGLFVEGRSVGTMNTWFGGVHYSPENGNPLVRCPYGKTGCEHSPAGLKFPWCPCQLSQLPYDYDSSVEKLEDERNRRKHEQWMEITGGQYCACVVDNNGYQGGLLKVEYNVNQCIRMGCKNEFCSIRKKQRDLKRVNIFYDIRRTKITRHGFLEETKVELEKGVKVFPRPVARTDAEIWLKTKKAEHDPIISKHIFRPHLSMDDRRMEYFSKYHRTLNGEDYFEFHYEVENIRIEARETRDLLQDLRDVADGIEVVHEADQVKAKKQKKRDNKAARIQAKERKYKKQLTEKILAADDEMAEWLKKTAIWRLGAEETERLYQLRADRAAGTGDQITLFESETKEG